jgi:membrane protease YdiL (CAAX protease family)
MPRGAGGLALTVLLAVVLAPIIEELLFRGWIYTALRARYSYVFVLLFTAGTFAVAHFERTGIYALVVFPVGLVLGWMRERTGSVFSTMAMHAIYNGSAVLTKLLLPD